MNAAPYKIVTVCTGNICRSPLAEALLCQSLAEAAFDISSAGIMAAVGAAVPRQQLRIAKKLNLVGLEKHQPQPLTQDIIKNSDLVLGMSRGHRKRIVRMDPGAVRKTFTIREFARLAPLVMVEDVEALVQDGLDPIPAAVEAVASKRGLLPPPKFAEEFDVIDPFKQKTSVYKLSRDELLPAAQVTSDFLNSIISIFGSQRRTTAENVVELDLPEVVDPETGEFTRIDTGQFAVLNDLPKRSEIRRSQMKSVAGPGGVGRSIPRRLDSDSRGA